VLNQLDESPSFAEKETAIKEKSQVSWATELISGFSLLQIDINAMQACAFFS
jgi:hypothetical protein